jgi:RNA polymerase sigma-70 factor (family 1)
MNAERITDESLKAIAARIADGDQYSFRILFHHFAGRLITFAQSMLGNKEAATEVVDDVWVRIWKNRTTLPQIENIRTYLYTATKNSSLNYLSAKARAMVTEPFNDITIQLKDEYCPEQQLITEEIFKKIHAAVQDLPPRCKMVFKLVREDGLKYHEVAEIMKISQNTVDAQMVIAVKRIREAIGTSMLLRSTPAIKKI